MRIRSLTVTTGTVLMLVATACSGGSASSPNSGNSSANATMKAAYREIQSAAPGKQASVAMKLAKKEGPLVLYTSMTSDMAAAVTEAFTKDTGIKVTLYRANSEPLLQRIEQESQSGRVANDVIETDFPAMSTLSQLRVMQKFTGQATSKVDPAGKFEYWTASRFNVFLPAWNTNLIKASDVPTSWEDLANPKYKGKLVMEISDSDLFENLTKYWLAHGKTQGQVDQLWKDIAANSKGASGHSAMIQLLGAGQTPMDFGNYISLVTKAAKKGSPVAYKPAGGKSTMPAFARPNGVGMMKDAPHPATAWVFYNWLLTDGQKVLIKEGQTPSVKGIPGDTTTEGITLAPYDVNELAAHQADWDKRYTDLLTGIDKVNQ